MRIYIVLWLLVIVACGERGVGPRAPVGVPADVGSADEAAVDEAAAGELPAGDAPAAVAQAGVVARPRLNQERAVHTATALADGSLLLAGGMGGGEQALASVERFDPATQSFVAAGSMLVARQSHSATLLQDGRVLIAGGYNGDYLATAEIYDPATGAYTAAGSMVTARSGHSAVLLPNGLVLVAGGTGVGWSFLDSAELYDPASDSFTATGRMTTARESHTATVLAGGDVLIAGGHKGRRAAITIYDSAELYRTASGTFAPTGPMTVRRHKHDAVLLADGRVFVSGGSDERDGQGVYRSTEIFDPVSEQFSAAGEMLSGRYKHRGTSLLLPSGLVLLIGGATAGELFDPADGSFRALDAAVGETRLFATATLLADGNVLLAGGYGPGVAVASRAWLIRPPTQ